ncbi:hypothetical protein AX17_005056 [Amanita inopinata Kibby_2008]|nr:hypothetical protein AX17_005056 [Amanita inopinata Kibby_2008]
MPSLFSRSRTTSTSNKKSPTFLTPVETYSSPLDEFGRVLSRTSSRDANGSLSKKDKKKVKERSQTLGTPRASQDTTRGSPSPYPLLLDGAFHLLSLEPPRNRENGEARPKLQDYGFLSYERHVILGPEQLARLINVVSGELSNRGGITTPFIFSTTALDVSYSSIRRLIRAFLDTCDMRSSPSVEKAEAKWRDEAKFAGLHELGMCLRWGLARVVRVSRGRDIRGLIAWEHYLKFRESEAAQRFPPGYFQSFLEELAPAVQSILTTVLTFLTRLTANSTLSGHTPPSLSPLFGPLIFGLGPASLSFHHTYMHYLRATNAMEHIILAFIRWQDTPRTGPSGSAVALGVPVRLKDWIKGYPAMLPSLNDPKTDTARQPRKGARTVRLLNVRRNVRIYTQDLVKTGASWGIRSSKSISGPSNGFSGSKEWERIAPTNLKLAPRYSDSFKKRMNLPPSLHPDCGPSHAATELTVSTSTSSHRSTVSSATSATSSEPDFLGLSLGPREGEDRFRSLTDLKWGEFESMGFGETGNENKLQFDLTESARQQRPTKRQSLSWNDFSSAGFSRNDTPLNTTLEFSSPISNTISSWPAHNAEISKKLKKMEKALPHFGWDTEPVIFNEEVIEEAFIDVFCDLVYGGGWMDGERYEEVERDSNWAMIEFKAAPPNTSTVSGNVDPRTTTSLILYEEFVPLEYRQKLAQSAASRRRLPSLFTTKPKQWKQATTLNGKPYEVGLVPRSPSYREVEFEGLLQADAGTKIISLNAPTPRATSVISTTQGLDLSSKYTSPPVHKTVSTPSKTDNNYLDVGESALSPSAKRMSRFRLPGGIPVPSPGGIKKSGVPPAQYSTVEFETRLASYSDDEFNNANETESVKQRRRQSKDDAWVDILVGEQARNFGNQDAEPKSGDRRRGLRSTHSDPDIASMEVAQVLAAVKNRSPSPPSMMDRVDRDYGLDLHVQDLDIDEVETAPRTSGGTRSYYSEHGTNGDNGDADNEEEEEEEEPKAEPEPEPAPEPEPEEEEEEAGDVLLTARLRARQGRPGYFDIHPERRGIVPSMAFEDEIREKLARDDSDDELDDPRHDQPSETAELSSASTPLAIDSESSQFDKTPVQEAFVPQHAREPESHSTPINGHHTTIDIPETKPTTPQSRTAALIEMYRQRERGGTSNPDSPSRIPVRPAPKEPTATPAPAIVPQAVATKPQEQDAPVIDLPRLVLEETGRASPGRYIHGAPLHNVLEEEEEED